MPKRSSKPGKRRDVNELAKAIVDQATGQEQPESPSPEDEGKDQAAVELGRRGGKKGGRARAKALTAEQRSAIARKAARKRWEKK